MIETKLYNHLHLEIVRELLTKIKPSISNEEVSRFANMCPNPWDAPILYEIMQIANTLSVGDGVEPTKLDDRGSTPLQGAANVHLDGAEGI